MWHAAHRLHEGDRAGGQAGRRRLEQRRARPRAKWRHWRHGAGVLLARCSLSARRRAGRLARRGSRRANDSGSMRISRNTTTNVLLPRAWRFDAEPASDAETLRWVENRRRHKFARRGTRRRCDMCGMSDAMGYAVAFPSDAMAMRSSSSRVDLTLLMGWPCFGVQISLSPAFFSAFALAFSPRPRAVGRETAGGGVGYTYRCRVRLLEHATVFDLPALHDGDDFAATDGRFGDDVDRTRRADTERIGGAEP